MSPVLLTVPGTFAILVLSQEIREYEMINETATAVKFAYRLSPGDVTGLGTVRKVISGEGTTEVWFNEYPDSVSHVCGSMAEVKVTFSLDKITS